MELGGDSVGLQKALKDVDDKAKALSSEMREVDRALKLDPTNTELLAQKQKLLSEQVENAKEKLRQLRDVQEQVTQQFEKGEIGEEAYRAFQREVAVAEANVNRLDAELTECSRTMNNTSDSTDELANDLDDAGDDIKILGKEADTSGGKLEGFGKVAVKIGKAAAAALAAIGASAVATGKKIWDMSNETAAAGDEIDKTSQKIGISAESYQEWGYVFERCGADVNHLQTGMKKLSGVIADAGNGSDSAKEKLAAVGLTIDDLNGKSQDEQLSVVITALQDMESGAERTAAATDLLGNSAVDMAAVLNTGAEETQALKDEAKEYGMIMSNEAVAASAAFEDSLTKLNRTVSGVKNRLTSDLLPGLSDIMDGFSDLVAGNDHAAEKIEKGVNDLLKKISKMIPRIAGMIGTVVAAVAKSFSLKPYFYFDAGQKAVSTSERTLIFHNFTDYAAEPVITLFGNGLLGCNFNGRYFIVKDVVGSVRIDCEAMSVYSGGVNKFDDFSGLYPALSKGNTTLSFTGTEYQRAEVIPRWRRL